MRLDWRDPLFYGVMAGLVAIDVLDPPVGIVLVVGKLLADQRHSKLLQAVGQDIEEDVA